METVMGSASARKILNDIYESLPTQRRTVVYEGISYSDFIERVHQLKIMIRFKVGCEQMGRVAHKKQDPGYASTRRNGMA